MQVQLEVKGKSAGDVERQIAEFIGKPLPGHPDMVCLALSRGLLSWDGLKAVVTLTGEPTACPPAQEQAPAFDSPSAADTVVVEITPGQ